MYCGYGVKHKALERQVIDMNTVDIGKYLTELRKYYKITQDELAGRLSVTRQAVSKWENGD